MECLATTIPRRSFSRMGKSHSSLKERMTVDSEECKACPGYPICAGRSGDSLAVDFTERHKYYQTPSRLAQLYYRKVETPYVKYKSVALVLAERASDLVCFNRKRF